MDLQEKVMWWFVGVIVFLVIGIPIIISIISIVGIHYDTGRGEHTGFVTAVEKSGIFFKTGRAYIKTDTQSSQEDSYCVIDNAVYGELQKYVTAKTHVNVYYFSWLAAGIKYCGGEGDIIYKVEPIVV